MLMTLGGGQRKNENIVILGDLVASSLKFTPLCIAVHKQHVNLVAALKISFSCDNDTLGWGAIHQGFF